MLVIFRFRFINTAYYLKKNQHTFQKLRIMVNQQYDIVLSILGNKKSVRVVSIEKKMHCKYDCIYELRAIIH